MIGTIIRRMTMTRLRSVLCLVAFVVLIGIGVFAWHAYCLIRAQNGLSLRQDASARVWLDRSLAGLFPDARYFLMRNKLARRSGNVLESNRLLDAAKRKGAPAAEVKRERILTLAQRLQFESFTSEDWIHLIEDPRDDEPEIAKSFVTWANSRFQFNDVEIMLNVWEKDFPNDPDPYFLRGQTHAAMSNWQDAETSFRRAIKLAPQRADIQLALGMALKEQFKFKEAIDWLRQSHRNNPQSKEPIYELALSLFTDGDSEAAIEAAEEGLKAHPDDLDFEQLLGSALQAKGETERAIKLLRKAYQSRPEDASLAYRLAMALQVAGLGDEAKPLFEFVKESKEPLLRLSSLNEKMIQSPNDVAVRFEIASITSKYVSRSQAKRWFQNILRIDPNHRETHLALADILRQEGNAALARQHREFADKLPHTGN